MSGPLVSASAAFVAKNSRIQTFAIEQSLRIDGSAGARLTRTPSSSGNRRTFTLSMWFKRVVVTPSNHDFLFATNQSWFADYFHAKFENSDATLNLSDWPGGTSGTPRIGRKTLGAFRDYSAWTHYVVAIDTTDATAQNRARVYINGVEQTSFSYNTNPTQNAETTWNHTVIHTLGNFYDTGGTNSYNDKYLAEFYNVDGQQLDASSFGEFDDNGVWRPIKYTGTYGTNGFYLKFDPTAANGVGHDHSGNGHHFSTIGVTTSGTGTDVMSDTPTTNYCTWNPLTIRNGSGTMSLTEGNLKFGSTASTTYGSILATISPTSGKYYCELTFEGTKSSNYNRELFGIVPIANWQTNTRVDVQQILGSLVYESNGTSSLAHQGTGSVANTQSYGVAWDENSNIGIAIDFDTPSLSFYVDGSSQGTFPYSMTAGEAYAIFAVDWSNFVEISAFILNAGQRAFEYTPPAGFKALNTRTLPAPDIADGSDNFNTVLYTGNGADRNIDVADNSGNNWQPDLVWIKQRSGSATDHRLFDQVRGGGAVIRPNNTNAEQTASDDGIYFAYADGFNIDYGTNGANYNGSSQTYAAWNWLAGGSGSSNTDGSITSTVSANPTAGFSVVTYSGTSTDNDTIGHGLGVAPAMVIVKNRTSAANGSAGSHWLTRHQSIGMTGSGTSCQLFLNLPNGLLNNDHGTLITSGNNLLQIKASGSGIPYFHVGQSGQNYVAYCFAEIESYSKFGSYVGNGSDDGPFVALPFTPAFVMIKNTIGTQDWQIRDNQRLGYNPADRTLAPNDPRTENGASSSYAIDLLSNGFKIRGGLAAINGSGNTIVFAAFASSPFGGSGVSPATAR